MLQHGKVEGEGGLEIPKSSQSSHLGDIRDKDAISRAKILVLFLSYVTVVPAPAQ